MYIADSPYLIGTLGTPGLIRAPSMQCETWASGCSGRIVGACHLASTNKKYRAGVVLMGARSAHLRRFDGLHMFICRAFAEHSRI